MNDAVRQALAIDQSSRRTGIVALIPRTLNALRHRGLAVFRVRPHPLQSGTRFSLAHWGYPHRWQGPVPVACGQNGAVIRAEY